jgi:hypothetical protein
MSKGASYKRYQRRWRRGEKEILRDGVVVAVCPEADRERARHETELALHRLMGGNRVENVTWHQVSPDEARAKLDGIAAGHPQRFAAYFALLDEHPDWWLVVCRAKGRPGWQS